MQDDRSIKNVLPFALPIMTAVDNKFSVFDSPFDFGNVQRDISCKSFAGR